MNSIRDRANFAVSGPTSLKIFFFSTTGPISIKLGTKHPWVKGIQVYSNEGTCPNQLKTNKNHLVFKKEIMSLFSRNQCNGIGPNHTMCKYVY